MRVYGGGDSVSVTQADINYKFAIKIFTIYFTLLLLKKTWVTVYLQWIR